MDMEKSNIPGKVWYAPGTTAVSRERPVDEDLESQRLATSKDGYAPEVPVRDASGNPRMKEDAALKIINPWNLSTMQDSYTKSWFEYMQHNFPQSVKKIGEHTFAYNHSTLQLSIMLVNFGNFSRKAHVQNRQIKDPDVSLIQQFWGNNYAHVIMTVEADGLPRDAVDNHLRFGLMGAHSNNTEDLCTT